MQAAPETKAAAHDASYTVSERMQGMSVSVQEAAKGAAKSISDTLQYGYLRPRGMSMHDK